MVSIALKHDFAPPAQFILLERALMEVEGVARAISPDFDLNEMLLPIIGEVVKDKTESVLDPIRALQTAQDYRTLVQKGPKKAYSVLEKLDSGTLVVGIDPEFIKIMRRDMWRIVWMSGVSVAAMLILFFIVVGGVSFKLPILSLSVSAAPVLIFWLIGIWWIYRKWKGPR